MLSPSILIPATSPEVKCSRSQAAGLFHRARRPTFHPQPGAANLPPPPRQHTRLTALFTGQSIKTKNEKQAMIICTKLTKAGASNTLRTTVPMPLVQFLELQSGDELVWRAKVINGCVEIMVRIKRSEALADFDDQITKIYHQGAEATQLTFEQSCRRHHTFEHCDEIWRD